MMTSEFENSFRKMLKSVVREVFDEVLREREFETHRTTTSAKPVQDEERLLLRAREAAKRLAISQRHLQRLTAEGVLPCVRVGNLRHYSVETIERWIRESESADAPEPRKKAPTGKSEAKSPPAAKPRKTEPKKKRTSKKATRKTKTSEIEPKRANKKRQPKKEKLEPEEEKRIGPFDLLLEEIGVDRDDLPPLTNGDLRRVADVDIPTMHGWQYLHRELPEEALQRLREHFIQYRKD